jgi:hypothetical protein
LGKTHLELGRRVAMRQAIWSMGSKKNIKEEYKRKFLTPLKSSER